METPNGTFTIAEAAERWIGMIEAPETKATREQKDALIAQIRAAAPKVIGTRYGVANVALTEFKKLCFTDATNAIKRVIRGEAK